MKRYSFGTPVRRFVAIMMVLLLTVAVPDMYSSGISVAQTSKSSSTKKKSSKSSSKSNSKSASKSNSKSSSKSNAKSGGKSKSTADSNRGVSSKNNRQNQKKGTNAPKTSAEAKRMQEATQREIQQTKEKLRLNEQEIKTGLSDLNRLSSEIATGRVQVETLRKKVASLNGEINTLGSEITKNEAELALMREEYLKAVKKMRLTKKKQSTLAFIFASDNFNQAMRRIRYMRQFSAWKEKKSADIEDKVVQLGRERERLSVVKDAQSVALGQLNKSQAELEVKHKQQEKLVGDLRQNGDALQAHLVAKQNEANRLKQTISALIAQEQARAEAERRAREKAEAERKAAAERAAAERAAAEKGKGGKKKKQQDSKGKDGKKKREDNRKEEIDKAIDIPVEGSNFASLRGKLPRPVDGGWRITNAFGRHSMPELPEVEYDNPGIDAEVAAGTSVKSVYGGKVSGVYKVAGYGTVVIVNHGDYYTVYGNLSSTNVAVGTQVGSGHILGSAGPDPDDSRRGSVHFEVWKGREKQNPSVWLR